MTLLAGGWTEGVTSALYEGRLSNALETRSRPCDERRACEGGGGGLWKHFSRTGTSSDANTGNNGFFFSTPPCPPSVSEVLLWFAETFPSDPKGAGTCRPAGTGQLRREEAQQGRILRAGRSIGVFPRQSLSSDWLINNGDNLRSL
ncbi:Hypp2999 [Branchiostoma lanceolatum]|uniref:Hypp2999 protein n=1 Tax=Branchiostoma lanceolatum TaxID=7740 RepID=A0A8K0EQ48_BRALA|nr:Hypp2999 [Branchiostoma lanceolatum]